MRLASLMPLSFRRTATVVPKRLAMPLRVSPDLTVYRRVGAGLAVEVGGSAAPLDAGDGLGVEVAGSDEDADTGPSASVGEAIADVAVGAGLAPTDPPAPPPANRAASSRAAAPTMAAARAIRASRRLPPSSESGPVIALGRSSATGATRGTRRATRASKAARPSGGPVHRARRAPSSASKREQITCADVRQTPRCVSMEGASMGVTAMQRCSRSGRVARQDAPGTKRYGQTTAALTAPASRLASGRGCWLADPASGPIDESAARAASGAPGGDIGGSVTRES